MIKSSLIKILLLFSLTLTLAWVGLYNKSLKLAFGLYLGGSPKISLFIGLIIGSSGNFSIVGSTLESGFTSSSWVSGNSSGLILIIGLSSLLVTSFIVGFGSSLIDCLSSKKRLA